MGWPARISAFALSLLLAPASTVFSGGPCSTGTCGDIDFDNDGLFPDTTDIDKLLSVFSGSPC